MRVWTLLAIAIAGCGGALPSKQPLGGRSAASHDRRATTASQSYDAAVAARSVQSTAGADRAPSASAPAAPVVPTAASSAPTASAYRGVLFSYRPEKLGASVIETSVADMRFTFRVREEGVETIELPLSIRVESRTRSTLTKLSGSAIEELRVDYLVDRNSLVGPDGAIDQPSPVAGKSYDVSFAGTTLRVRPRKGGNADAEEKARVDEDAGAIARTRELLLRLAPERILPGAKFKLEKKWLGALIGTTNVEVRDAEATFEGMASSAGGKSGSLARFGVSLVVEVEEEGLRMTMTLRGTAIVEPGTLRVREVTMSGPASARGEIAGTDATASGDVKIRVTYEH